jgi:hypothetical protein
MKIGKFGLQLNDLIASTKVHSCLLQLQECAQHQKNMTKGTQFYLHIISSYIDVILSTHFSLFDRCKDTSKGTTIWKFFLVCLDQMILIRKRKNQ